MSSVNFFVFCSPSLPSFGSVPYVLPGVIGRSLPFGGGLLEDLEFI